MGVRVGYMVISNALVGYNPMEKIRILQNL